jgi:hypothetical protein
MSPKSPQRSIAATALGALVGLSPGLADACQGVMTMDCIGAHVTAAPANTQLLTFYTVFDQGGVYQTPYVALRDESGQSIGVTVSADPHLPWRWFLRPEIALTEGATYAVSWQQLCAIQPNYPTPDATEGTVIVPKAAPFPTRLGTLSLESPPWTGTFDEGMCEPGPFDGVFARLKLTLDDSMLAYREVTDLRAVVDGVQYDTWFRPKSPFQMSTIKLPRTDPEYLVVVVSCDPGVKTNVTSGVHRVGFRAFVADSDAPLIEEMELDLTCPATAPVSPPPPSTTIAPTSPQRPSPVAPVPDDPTQDVDARGSSCAQSRIRSAAGPGELFAIAFALVCARARRRPRESN